MLNLFKSMNGIQKLKVLVCASEAMGVEMFAVLLEDGMGWLARFGEGRM
jgi:hypothetical protein